MSLGFGDDPLIRSIIISVMLQGCTNSALRWFQNGVAVSHSDSKALHAGLLVGYAAQLAQVVEVSDFEPVEVADRLIKSTEESELKGLLVRARALLEKKRSVASAARDLGYRDGVPCDIYASAILGIYAWLRHPKSYRQTVERTILLGGFCSSAAVVSGSLSGIFLGRNRISDNWVKDLTLYPYNRAWRENLIDRVKDWPHGVEDIQRAYAVPSLLFRQLIRNCFNSVYDVFHLAIRLPVRLTLFSVRKRDR